MNVKEKIENKEKFSVELTIEIGADEFEAGLDRAYKKNRGSISVPGFRKGKAPRKVIEGMYGSGVFYQDAVEELYPAACDEAVAAEALDIVAQPSIEILEAGKEGLTFKAIFTIRPEVALSDYKGLEADRVIPEITEQMVEDELQVFIERASHMEAVDRAAALGDSTTIDFEGFQEGIPFQGGKGENFELLLGSHSFIPGFEEQLIGLSAGEEKEIEVTFPEDYHMDDLKGKPAKFKVKVHEVKAKVVPELDDEFAKDISEFETLDAFQADLKAKLTERLGEQSEGRFRQAILDQLAEKVTIELPEPMLEAQLDRSVEEFKGRLQAQGIAPEMYYQYLQSNEFMMREQMRPSAEQKLRTQLALEGIARAEKIEISEEELTAEYGRLAEEIQISVEELERVVDRPTFRLDMQRERAMNLVIEQAKANEITEETLRLQEAKRLDDEKAAKEKAEKEKETAAKETKKPAEKAAEKEKEEPAEEKKKPARKPRKKAEAEPAETEAKETEEKPVKKTRKPAAKKEAAEE